MLDFDLLQSSASNKDTDNTVCLRIYSAQGIKLLRINRYRTITIKKAPFRSKTLTFSWSTGRHDKSVEIDLTPYRKFLNDDEIRTQDLKLMISTGLAILLGLIVPTIKQCCFTKAK